MEGRIAESYSRKSRAPLKGPCFYIAVQGHCLQMRITVREIYWNALIYRTRNSKIPDSNVAADRNKLCIQSSATTDIYPFKNQCLVQAVLQKILAVEQSQKL